MRAAVLNAVALPETRARQNYSVRPRDAFTRSVRLVPRRVTKTTTQIPRVLWHSPMGP